MKNSTFFPFANKQPSIEQNTVYIGSLRVLKKTVENKYSKEPLYGICFQIKKQ